MSAEPTTPTLQENITLLLAIIGSLGTISNWIYYWICSRKNITISIAGHRKTSEGIYFYIMLTNNSHQTITINDISILYMGKEYFCSPIPVKVREVSHYRKNVVTERSENYTIQFPIILMALCGSSGFLYYPFDPKTSEPFSSTLTVVIRTNRGRAIRKSLVLDKVLPY